MKAGKTKKHDDQVTDVPTPQEEVEASQEAVGEQESSEIPLETPEERIASLEDKLLRAKADFQNLQRRSATERAEAIRFANAELMRSMLGVLDDFERALQAAEMTDNKEAVIEGVQLVYDNLMKALKDAGLEPIDAMDEQFDPNFHEALMQQPTSDVSPGTVVDQIARGYRLRDRVLRPARVIVAKAKGDAAAGDSNTEE